GPAGAALAVLDHVRHDADRDRRGRHPRAAIALAGVGALAGVALLAVLGLVNALTIAALAEAFTRNGRVRYGPAFFGRVAGDFLGRPGALALATTVAAYGVFILLAYCVGVARALADATTLPAWL